MWLFDNRPVPSIQTDLPGPPGDAALPHRGRAGVSFPTSPASALTQ